MPSQFPDYRLNYGGQSQDLLSMYNQMNPSKNIGQAASGLGTASGMAGMLPWVGPALQGAGLLANLYGGMSANEQAEKNYELQKKQYEDEARARTDERQRLIEAQKLANIYSSANYSNELGQQNKPEWAQFLRQVRA